MMIGLLVMRMVMWWKTAVGSWISWLFYSTTCDKTPTDPKEMQVDEFGPQEENPDEEAFDETVQFGT